METITRKRMLYKSKVEYMAGPGVYTMNHVQGCAHGCRYPCYAYLAAKRFGKAESEGEWMTPKPVENAIELLEKEIEAPRKEPIRRVHMCFTTDPLPWGTGCSDRKTLERIHWTTLQALKELNEHRIPVTFLTKGALPTIESSFFEGSAFATVRASSGVTVSMYADDLHPMNEYGISLVTHIDTFRVAWEPGAAHINHRIQHLKRLHGEGMRTWVSIEPFPTLRMQAETCGRTWDATDVLALVPFVDRVVFGRWNYGPKITDDEQEWYRKQAEDVRKWCKRRGVECHIKKGIEL